MGFFLPVLLLALSQPAETPQTAQAQPDSSAIRVFSVQSGDKDRQEAPSPFDDMAQTGTDVKTCFTMRSYYFQRQDDAAPKPVRMTTCESSHKVQQKKAKLVPAN